MQRNGHNLENYQLTPDERLLFKECNRESFFKRSLPFGFLMGLTTYYTIKIGYFARNPKWGVLPKVSTAVIIGYFVGKFSYLGNCAEKLAQLPNSPLGEMIRKKRLEDQRKFQPSPLDMPPIVDFSQEIYNDISEDLPKPILDIESGVDSFPVGLDDLYKSFDDIKTNDDLPQKSTTTYNELRQLNRENAQKFALQGDTRQAYLQAKQRDIYDHKYLHQKNIYGDVIDD